MRDQKERVGYIWPHIVAIYMISQWLCRLEDHHHRRMRGGGRGAAVPLVEQNSATFGQFS